MLLFKFPLDVLFKFPFQMSFDLKRDHLVAHHLRQFRRTMNSRFCPYIAISLQVSHTKRRRSTEQSNAETKIDKKDRLIFFLNFFHLLENDFLKIRQFPLRNLRKFENLSNIFCVFFRKNAEIPENFHQNS